MGCVSSAVSKYNEQYTCDISSVNLVKDKEPPKREMKNGCCWRGHSMESRMTRPDDYGEGEIHCDNCRENITIMTGFQHCDDCSFDLCKTCIVKLWVPDLPSLPDIGLPSLPDAPSLPSLPDAPSLPSLSAPDLSAPSLPSLGSPFDRDKTERWYCVEVEIHAKGDNSLGRLQSQWCSRCYIDGDWAECYDGDFSESTPTSKKGTLRFYLWTWAPEEISFTYGRWGWSEVKFTIPFTCSGRCPPQ
jgi:hypothetical protein